MLPNPSVSAARKKLTATLLQVRSFNCAARAGGCFKNNSVLLRDSRELGRAQRSDSLYYNPSRFYSRDINVREAIFPKLEQLGLFSRKLRRPDFHRLSLVKSPSRGFFWTKKEKIDEDAPDFGNPQLSEYTMKSLNEPYDVGDTEGRIIKLPEGFTPDWVVPARLADETAIAYKKYRPIEMLLRESGVLPSAYLDLITRERILRSTKRIQVFTPETRTVMLLQSNLDEETVRSCKREMESPYVPEEDPLVMDPVMYSYHFPGVADPDELPTDEHFAKFIPTDVVRRPITDITADDFDYDFIHKLADPDVVWKSRAEIWNCWEYFDQDYIAHVPGFSFFRPMIAPPLLSEKEQNQFDKTAELICDVESLLNPLYVMQTPFGWPVSSRQDYVDEMQEQRKWVDILTPKENEFIQTSRMPIQTDSVTGAKLYTNPPEKQKLRIVRGTVNKLTEARRQKLQAKPGLVSRKQLQEEDLDEPDPDELAMPAPNRPKREILPVLRKRELPYVDGPVMVSDSVFKSRSMPYPEFFDSTLVHTLIDELGIPLYASACHAELVDRSKLVQLDDVTYKPAPEDTDPAADEFCEEGAEKRQLQLNEYYEELERKKWVEPAPNMISDPAIVHSAGGLSRITVGELTGTPSNGQLAYAQTRTYQLQNDIHPRDVVNEHFPNLGRVDLSDFDPEDRSQAEEVLLDLAHDMLEYQRGEGQKIGGYDANQLFYLPSDRLKVYKFYLEDPPALLYEHPDCRSFMHWHWWPEYRAEYGDRYPLLRAHHKLPTPGIFILQCMYKGYQQVVLAYDWAAELPMKALAVMEKPSLAQPLVRRIGNVIAHEAQHFADGFKLLWKEAKISFNLIIEGVQGKQLNRREKKQLTRTGGDLLRLVPFVIIILIPFMELALPLLLKIFPNMLPSTFRDEQQEIAKARAKLRAKLFVVDVLQDSVGNCSSNLDTKVKAKASEMDIKVYDKMQQLTVDQVPRVIIRPNYHGKRRGLVLRLPSFEFTEYQAKAIIDIINSQPPIDDVSAMYSNFSDRGSPMKQKLTLDDDLNSLFEEVFRGEKILHKHHLMDLAKLYRGDSCLIKLNKTHLARMCKHLNIKATGPDHIIRQRITDQCATLRKDDEVLFKETTKDMTYEEVKEASLDRGLRTTGCTLVGMRSSLNEWIDLTVVHNVHASLIILTRVLRINETLLDDYDEDPAEEIVPGVLPIVDPFELVDHEDDLGKEDDVSVETQSIGKVAKHDVLKAAEEQEGTVLQQMKDPEAANSVKREEEEILSPFDGRDLAMLTELLSIMAKGDPLSDIRKELNKLKLEQNTNEEQIEQLQQIARNEEDELNSVITTLTVPPAIIPLSAIQPDGSVITSDGTVVTVDVVAVPTILPLNKDPVLTDTVMAKTEDGDLIKVVEMTVVEPIVKSEPVLKTVEMKVEEKTPVDEPTTVVEQIIVEKPVVDQQPVQQHVIVSEPVEQIIVEKRISEQPIVEQEPVEHIIVDQPIVEKPVVLKTEDVVSDAPFVGIIPIVKTDDTTTVTDTTTGTNATTTNVITDPTVVQVTVNTTTTNPVEDVVTVSSTSIDVPTATEEEEDTEKKPDVQVDKALVDLNDAALDLEDNQEEINKVSQMARSLGGMIHKLEADIKTLSSQLPAAKILDSDNDHQIHADEIKEVILQLPGGHTAVEAENLVKKLLSLMNLRGPTIPTDRLHRLAELFSGMSEDEKVSFLASHTHKMVKSQSAPVVVPLEVVGAEKATQPTPVEVTSQLPPPTTTTTDKPSQ